MPKALLACLVLISACESGKPAPGAIESQSIAKAELPVLRPLGGELLITEATDGSSQPSIAVSPNALVALISPGTEDGRMIHLLDTTGTVVAAFGPQGQGPGELSAVGSVFMSHDRLYTYDLSNRRFTVFDLAGKVLGSSEDARFLLPFAVHGDSSDNLETDGSKYWIVRRRLSGKDRTVINRGDSVPPARASTPTGFVLGDGTTYRLDRYDSKGLLLNSFGRSGLVPPRLSESQIESQMTSLARFRGPDGKLLDPIRLEERRKELRSQEVPFFPRNRSLEFDGAGRLWIVGSIGDSAFADLFADTLFLGRLTFDCPDFRNMWALSGAWLALVCGPPEGSDRSALVRLFELTEH
jgi:hypothetical protein